MFQMLSTVVNEVNEPLGQTNCDFHSQTKSDSCRKSTTRGEGSNQVLPSDFVPSCYTVIIGRGKRIAQTVGNRRLQILAKMYLPQYAKAMKCRAAKTRIVNKIVAAIKSACADNHCEASFVRYSKGRFYMVNDSVAREKVGYQLRDLLGDKYESSSKSKVAKNRRQRFRNRKKNLGDNDDEVTYSSNSSGNSSRDWDGDGVVVRKNQFEISVPISLTSTSIRDTEQKSPISLQQPTPFHLRRVKRMSFDAIELLKQPLLCSRDSIVLMDDHD